MGLGNNIILGRVTDSFGEGCHHIRVRSLSLQSTNSSDTHPSFNRSIWTKYTLIAIPGSFVFTMIFLPLYSFIAPLLGFSREYTNIVPRLWSSIIFWLTIFGMPFLLLTRDFAWKACVISFLVSLTINLMISECSLGIKQCSSQNLIISYKKFKNSICLTIDLGRHNSRKPSRKLEPSSD
jgi:hypothetical protein